MAPVLEVAEVAGHPQFRPGGWSGRPRHPTEGELRQLAPLLAGMPRAAGPVALPDLALTDTEQLLKEAGVDGETVAGWVARGVVA